MSNKKVEKFGINTERRSFHKPKYDLEPTNLLDIQKVAFKKFLETGIDEVLNEIYPISSTKDKIRVEFIKSNIKLPKDPEKEIEIAKSKGTNYYVPVKASFRMKNNLTGEVKTDDSVFIANMPMMTDGGSFIINGSERVIISQIVRAPGAYFENMKAARAQSSSDASVFKLTSIIPNRGAWLEWDYKDYKLLGIEQQDVKFKLDKSKRMKAALLFYSLGMTDADITSIFGESDLLMASIDAVSNKEKEPRVAREAILKAMNTGDKITERAVNEFLPALLFNKKRYDLSLAGRYKLNKKLSIVNRIIGKILADDILDINGKVLVAKNTEVTTEVAQKLNEWLEERKVKTTNINFDETFVQSLEAQGISSKDARGHFGQVIVARIYEHNNWKQLQKEGNETPIINVVGNTFQDEFTNKLTISDILATFGYMLNLEQGLLGYDDIDSLANRKIRTVEDLLKNQFRIGLSRIEKNLKDRISAKDTTQITIKSVTNYKVMESALKEFFNSSQLSQFMDQVNPLSEISNKRRVTSLGPGGLSRDTASLVVRGIHDTHYGRIDPIETPEGPNIGLILNLALYAKVNRFGLIETPYFKVEDGKINWKNPVYMSVDDERIYTIATGSLNTDDVGHITDKAIVARRNGEFITVKPTEIDFADVSSKQIVSIASAHIPFLENDDANRALMGANMQRQAVPLIKPAAPIVATGIEQFSAKTAPTTLKAKEAGTVVEVDSARIIIENNDGKREKYTLSKFVRSNQATAINQIPVVKEGQKVKEGQVIADGPSVDNGELAIGQNVVVAFTSWRGYNYEDAIIISERLLKDDVYTSIHIEEYRVEQRTTKLGDEKITRDIPNASKDAMRNLDENGIIIVGSEVKVGDILIGKVTPKGEDDLSPEEKILDAILGYKAKNIKDSSLRVPYGAEGIVIDVQRLSINDGDKLDDGISQIIKVFVAQKRKIREGDKMSGRHGNKGVVSRVLPVEDMPYLEDGTPIDIMLNPLGVPSRMNIGQVLEIHLGMAAKKLGIKVATPVFDGATFEEVIDLMKEAKMDPSGKAFLIDGITGEKFHNKVAVGVMYMLKLSHMVDDKMHARSIGPYSLITQQPLRGKSQNGGQRFGEMEAWALEAYGASNLLQEMVTLKSDDIHGRNELYNAVAKGKKLPMPNIPEGFWVLYYELRGLGLTLDFINEQDEIIEVDNTL